MVRSIIKFLSVFVLQTYLASYTFAESDGTIISGAGNIIGSTAVQRNADQTRKDDGSFHSETATVTSPLTMGYFTLPYASQSLECKNIATGFVFINQLCDARDPESYLSSNIAYYSCVGRCGKIPQYRKFRSKECACDKTCLLYGDCCRDIHVACPESYISALASFPFYKKYVHACSNSIMAFRLNVDGMNYGSEGEFVTQQTSTAFVAPLVSLQSPRTLKQLVKGFGGFYVADVASGLVYESLITLASYKEASTLLYFLPIIVSLECSEDILTEDITSVTKSLKWCKSKKADLVQTPFHRSCPLNEFITCQCGDGPHLTDHLHNACIGFNDTISRLSRRQIYNHEINAMYRAPIASVCTIDTRGVTKFSDDGNMKISISSIPAIYALASSKQAGAGFNLDFNVKRSWVENNRQKSKGNIKPQSNENSNGEKRHESIGKKINKSRDEDLAGDTQDANVMADTWFQNGRPVKEKDLVHVVEISNTIERRLLCPSLKSILSDCQLLDCVRGAILTHDSTEGSHFGGKRCLWLSDVIVKTHASDSPAPLCWCMQVLTLLSNLYIWDVKMRDVEKSQCIFDLILLYEDHKEPMEAYDLGRNARLPIPQTKWTLSLEDLTTRFKNIYLAALPDCYGNSQPQDVDVCFRLSDTETSTTDAANVFCEVIQFGEITPTSSFGPTIYFYPLLNLFSCVFTIAVMKKL